MLVQRFPLWTSFLFRSCQTPFDLFPVSRRDFAEYLDGTVGLNLNHREQGTRVVLNLKDESLVQILMEIGCYYQCTLQLLV